MNFIIFRVYVFDNDVFSKQLLMFFCGGIRKFLPVYLVLPLQFGCFLNC